MPLYTIYYSKIFTKRLAKLLQKDSKIGELINYKLEKLRRDPFYSGLKTHKIIFKSELYCYSSRVNGDIRILWEFAEDENTISLIDIGGHSGKNKVYK